MHSDLRGRARPEALGAARSAAALAGAVITTAVRLGSIRWQLRLPDQLEAPRERPLFPARAVARATGEHPVPRSPTAG